MDFFSIDVSRYCPHAHFQVHTPASLFHPKDHAVMFIQRKYMHLWPNLREVRESLIFWPEDIPVEQCISEKNAVVLSENPHLSFCKFFHENKVDNQPKKEEVCFEDGYWISPKAQIGRHVTILPGAYIGGDVQMGDDCYIGAGVKMVGRVHMGDRVVIRENTVVGADGLTTDRDSDGKPITMPQFGGVVLKDDVRIGANTIIARGAIDDTVIGDRSKVDNCCFISHNVTIGKDTFIVGESIMFGSSSAGDQVLLSGNASIRNGVHIGDHALVGMSAVVLHDVPAYDVVMAEESPSMREKIQRLRKEKKSGMSPSS